MAAAQDMSKEAFIELQNKLVETTSKLKQVQMQIRNKEAEKKHALLTSEELEQLTDDIKTYRSVGRAFVLEPKAVLLSEQQERTKECDAAVSSLQSSKEYLERQMKEAENNFKELLQQSPALAQQVMSLSMS
eukprot:c18507_g1_i1 orf=300-695(-)